MVDGHALRVDLSSLDRLYKNSEGVFEILNQSRFTSDSDSGGKCFLAIAKLPTAPRASDNKFID